MKNVRVSSHIVVIFEPRKIYRVCSRWWRVYSSSESHSNAESTWMLWCRKSFECRESIRMQSTRIPKVNAESLRITRVFAQQESRQSEFVIGSFCFEELVCSWKVSVTSRLSERSPTESLRLSSDHTGVFCPDQLTVCQRRPINMLFWNESFGAFSFGVLIQMLHIFHFRWFISDDSFQVIHFKFFIQNSFQMLHLKVWGSNFFGAPMKLRFDGEF